MGNMGLFRIFSSFQMESPGIINTHKYTPRTIKIVTRESNPKYSCPDIEVPL